MSHTPPEPTSLSSLNHNEPAQVSPSSSLHGLDGHAHTSRLTERMLADLSNVRFRMARRSSAGYDVATVDDFVDQLERKVRSGEPVLSVTHVVRFPMASRWGSGYDVADVDAFLDGVEHLASEKGDAVEVANVSVPGGPGSWLRATNPVLWMVVLATVLVVVLYFL